MRARGVTNAGVICAAAASSVYAFSDRSPIVATFED